MCEHLSGLDNELKARGIKETSRGQAWTDNCREWVYYDCLLNVDKIRKRFNFPSFIHTHRNDDPRSGLEFGLTCSLCKDGIMGAHPDVGNKKIKVE